MKVSGLLCRILCIWTRTRTLLLIFYSPEGCSPCNTIVGNLQQYPEYRNSIGDNSFIVFPSISALWLANYQCMMKEHGNVNVRYINDKKLYRLLEQKDKEKLGDKPRWLGLDETSKKCVCFDLKE